MSRYYVTMQVSSCNVPKSLLEELEKYILRKGEEIIKKKSKTEGYIYSFVVVDRFGREELKSIREYERTHFSNNITGIGLHLFSYGGSPYLKISVEFGLEKRESEMEVSVEASNAKEMAQGIISEIGNLIKDHGNLNYLFSGNYGIFFYVLLWMSLTYTSWNIAEYFDKGRPVGLDGVIVGLVLLTSIIHYVLSKFNLYCIFDTRRNEAISRNVNWVLKSLGILLLGLLITKLII